jgi:hypothetical protein
MDVLEKAGPGSAIGGNVQYSYLLPGSGFLAIVLSDLIREGDFAA